MEEKTKTVTELTKAVSAAGRMAQYDQNAKAILGQKQVIAYILSRTVDEFRGMEPKDVEKFIEGDIYINQVRIDPGMTNIEKVDPNTGSRIIGLNTENSEVNEKLIRFDILFYVLLRSGRTRMMVNIEAQKEMPTSYHLFRRAGFYSARVVSSQKGRDFEGTDYDNVKDVLAIWIVMNADKCMWSHVHYMEDSVMEGFSFGETLNLQNYVFLGVPKELPERDEQYELHRLLATLLSSSMPSKERLDILQEEYHMEMTEEYLGKENTMCNLGEGIYEDGIGKGLELAAKITSMIQSGITDNVVLAAQAGCSEATVVQARNVFHM